MRKIITVFFLFSNYLHEFKACETTLQRHIFFNYTVTYFINFSFPGTAALRSRYYDRFEEITRTPIMEAFVHKFMENVRDFHIAVPVEELYYMYV